MTVGYLGRELRALEDRVTDLEGVSWKGDERRANAAFSDDQTKRIKELFDERAEVYAGRAFIRLILWAAGSFLTGCATVILAYYKLKG